MATLFACPNCGARFSAERAGGGVVVVAPDAGGHVIELEETLGGQFAPFVARCPARAPILASHDAVAVLVDRSSLDGLDPGIRSTVLALLEAGFVTTDSGDGVTKADAIAAGEALPYPHVFARVAHPAALLSEAGRLAALLGDAWTVEASYNPRDGVAVLAAMRLDA